MSRFVLAVVAFLTTILNAQQIRSPIDGIVYVRWISVAGDGLRPRVSFEAIQSAWKENGIALVELETTPEKLAEIAGRADKVIQQTYERAGRAVLVEH